MLVRLLLLASLLASPLAAQTTTVLSVCQDGPNGSPHTEEDMGHFLQGAWQMSAAGTGFTTGVNIMTVSLRFDETSGHLRMEGGGGPSIALMPLQFFTDDSGKETSNAPFDLSSEALTPTKLTETELKVLTDCSNPARYFWQFGSGNQKSWGGLMFVTNDFATGFMANSAGGSRRVALSRNPS